MASKVRLSDFVSDDQSQDLEEYVSDFQPLEDLPRSVGRVGVAVAASSVAILCLLPAPLDAALGLVSGTRSSFYLIGRPLAEWVVHLVSQREVWTTLVWSNLLCAITLLCLLLPARLYYLLHFVMLGLLVPPALTVLLFLLYGAVVVVNVIVIFLLALFLSIALPIVLIVGVLIALGALLGGGRR